MLGSEVHLNNLESSRIQLHRVTNSKLIKNPSEKLLQNL